MSKPQDRPRSAVVAEGLHELGFDDLTLGRLTGLNGAQVSMAIESLDEIMECQNVLIETLWKENRHLMRRLRALERVLECEGEGIPLPHRG